MNYLEIIITAIASLISGAGVTLLLFPQKKREAEIENDGKAIVQWKELYEQQIKESERKDALIERIYKTKDDLREENKSLEKRNTELEVENVTLRLLKCQKPACSDRIPPNDY